MYVKKYVDPQRPRPTKPKLIISENCRFGIIECSLEIMKIATSSTHPNTGLGGIQFTGVIDPEGPEKYNNTEMKSGRLSLEHNYRLL